VFDAKNKLHRKWFAEFNRSNSWGKCPVRFVVSEQARDLVTHIQRELIQFYVDKEFRPQILLLKNNKQIG
tara:strand:+ start:457 stop:666 length:210 start_codon:yes stop_codon:yes gene_type:complete